MEMAKILLEIHNTVPRSLNAQASLTVKDVRIIADFIIQKITKAVDRGYFIAGTGTVGRYWKQKWYQVWANDLQYYSYALNRHYIGNHHDLYFSGLTTDIPELLVAGVNTTKEVVLAYLSQIEPTS